MIALHRLRGTIGRLAVLVFCLAAAAVRADTAVQSSNFSFNHASAVSSGVVSVAGTYNKTDTGSPAALTFNPFNPALGRLTQVTVAVSTSTASFVVAPSGVLSLVSTASATRRLEYLVTAGATTGTDFNQVVTSGVTLVNLLGIGSADIGGAPLAKSSQFTSSTDLSRFSGSGTVSVGLTWTDTLSVTTLFSLFNGAGFSGSGTYAGTVTVTYTYTPWALTGTVYSDANHSGFQDAGEAGTGLTLYAKLLNESAPAGPALQAVTVNSASGAYSFGVARGTYRIVVDDNATLSDVTPLVPPSGWTGMQASSFLRTGVVVAADLGGQDFGLVYATTLCGRTFRDDGTGAGTANDGSINGTEAGAGGQTMQLLDAVNTVRDSAVAAQNGTYCLHIPSSVASGASLRVARVSASAFLATGASVGNTAGTYTRATDSLSFTNVAGQSYSNVNFGFVPVPTLSGGGEQGGTPSSVLWFAHRFTATTTGSVTFSASNVASPTIANLTVTIYLDANANGKIDAGEAVVTAPIAVTTGSAISLLVKVSIPATTPPMSRAQIDLRADLSFANASPALVYTLTSPEKLSVMGASSAALQLIKSVDKASAAPGATLVYTITFTNTGPGSIQQLAINDMTPPYTTFGSSSGLSLPASLGSMATSAPGVGGSGALRWSFPGQLMPGASGSIQFSVVVVP